MVGRRFVIEVVTNTGRAAGIEFRHHEGDVEIWHHGEKVAVLDRGRLCRWLRQPASALTGDGATLTLDRTVDSSGRVAITLADVDAWTLSPSDHQRLHSHLADR